MNSIKLVLAAAFAAVIGASYAVEVSGDTASKAARNWVRRGGLLGARMGSSVERADRHVTDSGSAFYTVRMAGGGTVITSADTDDEPIVAFTSETNDLSTIEKDSPLWALLNRRFKKSAGTSRPRLRLSTSSVTAEESDAAKRWGSLTNAPNRLSLKVSSTYIDGTENTVGDLRVPKLTTSKWNQASGGGYKAWNYYTPNNYLCGCVATAMAQIMYCHRWPAESPQNKTYKCYSDGNAVYLTTKGGAYDWDSMVDQPKKPSFTEAQAMAMSKLTYDCGVSVRMSYYDSASAAFDHYSVNQFKNLFGYASATYFDCYNGERRGYGTEAYLLTNNIERVLFSNFDAGYPVMLGIDGPTGGHEIVGDGYGYNDGLPYVHLNIGFGGGTDFWYLLPDMNGGSQSNFSMVDDVIYNIIPGTEQDLAVFSGRVKNADGTGIAGVTVSIREVQGGTTTQIATATANAYGVYGTSFVPKAGATYYAAVSGVSGYADGRSAAVGVSAPKVTTEIMGYEEDIERLVFKGADVGNSWGNDITLTAASSGPDYLDVIVAPMVKSKWSQLYAGGNINSGDPCYNYYTPGHTHCGCCPTAIAQIMRYHEWPKTAVRTDYFVDSYNEILGTYHVTTTAAYPCKYNDVATNMVMKGGVYDWSKMPYETRTSGTPEEQREMIGRLCHDVGVSMSTFYKGAGTGSSSPVVAHSLPGNFHYADASAIEFNTTKNMRAFKLDYFIRAVLPSLDAGLPCGLMIAGQYAGSHIVVCDGYGRHRTTGEIYVHLNVGYSGTDDGWFPLTENRAWRINGADYTDITGVVYNISPHFKGPIVSGHVVDKAGKAIAGATVTARREGVAITNVTTGARGQYNFKVLPGNYEVHVARDGLERTVYLQLESCINSAYIQTGDYIMNVVDTRIGNKWGEDIVLDASAAQVAAPLSIPADGSTFTGSAYIELFSDTAGADIYYTTDGTYPTTASTRYTEPFQITDSTTVHAIAFKDGMLSSALGTFSFVESTYGDVLNTPTTPWKSGGCARWYKDTVGLDTYASSTSTDTRDRLRSGVPATSQPKGSSSWLEATIDGPATVSFDYRYSTDYYSDFNVILDGATTNVHEHTYYTGNPEWKSVSSISIPAGEHKLRFEYYGTYKFDTTSTYGVYLRNMKIVYPNVLTGSVSSYANENWSTLLFSDGERNNRIWSQLSPTDAKVTLNGSNNRTVTVDIDAALHSLTLNNDVNLASDGTHKLTVGTVRVSGNTTLGVGALEVTGPISLTDLNASLTVPTGCDIVPKCGVSGAAVVETDVSGGKKYTLKAVYQSPFTATLSGSSVNWSNITFTDRNGNTANWATLNADAESKVSLNLTANATVTMNAPVAIRNLQVAGEGTLTLAKSGGNSLAVSGATTANANVTVTSGSATLGAVALADGKTLTIASTDAISSLTGAGTLVSSDNAWPTGKGLNDSGWTGTLKVTGGAMASDCDFNTVGNGGSKIEFAGAMASGGYLKSNQSFAGVLQLDTTLAIAGGTAGSTCVFSGPLTGSGAFATSGSVPANSVETYCFTGDVSGFGGTFTVNGNHAVVFGNRAADDNALCGKILIPSGKSITIPAGKTWTAANGIEVSGELTVPSGATVSGGARLTDPAAKVTVKGGATATVACAVEHYELVTTPSGSDTVYTLRIAKLTYTGPFSVTLTESAVNWADIVWNDSGNLPGKWANLEAGDESVLTITANSDVTITMTADAKASKIITLGGGKVTLLYAGGLDVPAGMKTALQKPEWTGIVKLAGSRTFAGTELGEYGNANSSIELANNIGGYLKNNGRCEAGLILDSGCLVTLNGGSAGYVYTFAGKLSGAGEFYFGGSTMCQFLCFTGDVTGFRGCINASYGRTVVYGEQAYNASSNNMVIVRSEVTAAANTASTVQGSVLVYGKLTLESGATIKQNWSTSAPVKLCALSAQVLVKSGCSIVPQSGITGQSLVTESVDGGTLYKFNYTPPTEPEPEDPNPPVVDPDEPEDPDEPDEPVAPVVSPIALWDGDFDETKANVTFDRNENTLAQDGEYVQIARTGTTAGGARFVLAPNIATSGVATVIFKVSDIPADEAFLISFHNKSTESSKANDPAGVYLTSALVPTQVNGGNRANATGTALTSGLATRKLAMTWNTSGWQLYEIMDDAATQKFACSGSHAMTFGGCTIGAAKAASSSNPIKSATGMKILSVALFDKMLTADELGAFTFASDSETDPDDPPDEPTEPFSLILAADANWEAAPWKGANDVAVPAERWSSAVQAAAIIAGENAGKLTLTRSLNLTALSVMGGTCAKPVVIAGALGNGGFSTPITIAANSVLKLVASCTGALTVHSGATVVLTGSAAPASIANAGTVELAYASAKNFADLKLSGAGLVRIAEGTVNAALGSLTNDIEVVAGATLNLTGELVAGQTYAITTGNLTLADSTSVTVGGIPLPEGWEVRDGIIAEKQDCMEVVWMGNSSTGDKTLTKPVVKGKPFTLIVHMTNTADTSAGSYIISKIGANQTITPFCVAADEYNGFTTGGAIPNDSLSYDEKKSGGWWCGVGSRSNSGNATWNEDKIGDEVSKLSSIYVAYSGTVADDGTVSDYVRMIYARKTSGEWYKLASTTASLTIRDDLDTMNINSSVDTLSVKAYLDYTQRNETQLISAIGEIDSNLPVGSCYYVVSINNNGSFTVPEGVSPTSVRLVYADGTPVANAKVDGRTITFDFEWKGAKAWWDFEFEGNLNNAGTGSPTALTWDGGSPIAAANAYTEDPDDKALKIPCRPYCDPNFPSELTVLMYGKMVPSDNTVQVGFGSLSKGTQNSIFLATGNVAANEVKLCLAHTLNEASTELCTMKVANAQTCDHLYAFVLKTVGGNTVVDTYLDGELLQPYKANGLVSLGTGFQVGSIHGGIGQTGFNRPSASAASATLGVLLAYDSALSPALIRRLAAEYPYVSPNGNYTRKLDTEVSEWATGNDNTWKNGDASMATTNEPAAQASVKLTSENGSTVRVNLAEDVEYETLTIGGGEGSGKIVITNDTGSTGKVVVTGRVIVNTDAVIDLGAVELKGTPITVAEGKHLTIDTTSYVIDDYLQDTRVNLTGAVATNAGAVVETALPEDAEGRTVKVTANASTSQYEMQVRVNPAEVKLALAVDDDQDVAFGGERHLDIPLDWTLQLTNTEALAHGQITKPNVAAALSSTAKIPNGIKPWESYVLSLVPTNAVSKPVPIPVQTAKPDFLCFKLGNVKVRDEVKDGLDVTYKVKTFASLGAAEPESVSESSNHTETIGVDMPESGVRYYRLEVDIAPRNNQHVDK